LLTTTSLLVVVAVLACVFVALSVDAVAGLFRSGR
jgi:hypothetical protein